MKPSTLGTGTAGAAALAVGALLIAPTASAVTPTTATVQANCGDFGSGEIRLEATQNGTAATITFSTSVVWSPLAIPANSVTTSLTLSNANGADVTFTGKSNPALKLGDGLNSGPLVGTVAPGDALKAKSVTITYLQFRAECTATSAQNPGPFTF
ncbi:hypothetical protein ACIQGZ_10640 [Streptomyces sp. NPDC092296]|uniref:hypothetical protein n=1 Tax=Streptomyces sp. NPDC092296 TaxID=3366012 RepID=UPI0038309B72